jgi:hypothetical protein
MMDKVAMNKQGEKSVDGTDSFANAATGKSYPATTTRTFPQPEFSSS